MLRWRLGDFKPAAEKWRKKAAAKASKNVTKILLFFLMFQSNGKH